MSDHERRVPTPEEQYAELKRYFRSHGLGTDPATTSDEQDNDGDTPDGAA